MKVVLRLSIVLFVLLTAGVMALPVQADTVTREPTSDTYIDQAWPSTNSCNAPALALREGSTIKRGYLTFDTSVPSGATNVSYTLRLFFNRSRSAGVTIYPTSQASSCTLTFNTAAAYDWQHPYASSGAVTAGVYKDIPLTRNTNLINGLGSSTFLVHAEGTFGKREPDLTFNSRDAASGRPQLVVSYTPPATTTTTTTTTTAPPPGDPKPNGPSGSFNLTFRDEFDGTAVDTTKWTDKSSSRGDCQQGQRLADGSYNNSQLEWNQLPNASVANGLLTITARRESATSPCTGRTYNWTSAGLSTRNYHFQYGVIEERSKQPSLRGFWPAFWTWQQPGANSWNEVDVYEYYSADHSRLYATVHLGGQNLGCTMTPAFDPSGGFHTYTADITAAGTTFYYDGQQVCFQPGAPVEPMDIITNLAVYEGVPPDAATTSETKQVEYVRAWSRA